MNTNGKKRENKLKKIGLYSRIRASFAASYPLTIRSQLHAVLLEQRAAWWSHPTKSIVRESVTWTGITARRIVGHLPAYSGDL